ncbi:hypothetical protein [Streptomyces sp. NPDC048272]|uniref:hypothetical protein n=1 Tax=Streptomyces sp. NPDC048272 TaxID=3154616 RepID=UPI00344265A5
MDTTTAARTARVTVATIRTWCRIGAVTATKTAGKWTVDATSLAHRIAIGARRKRFTIQTAIALGGREWKTDRHHRVYFNDWLQYAEGIYVSGSGTGRGGAFTIDGEAVSSSRLPAFRSTIRKVYFDAHDSTITVEYDGNAEAVDVRFIDGHRQYINLSDRVIRGIRAAAKELR